MNLTTNVRDESNNGNTNACNGQSGSVRSVQNGQISSAESIHQTQIPLPQTTGTEGVDQDQEDPRQRQPSGPPDEAPAYELDQSMEGAMDGIDWDWLDTYLRELE